MFSCQGMLHCTSTGVHQTVLRTSASPPPSCIPGGWHTWAQQCYTPTLVSLTVGQQQAVDVGTVKEHTTLPGRQCAAAYSLNLRHTHGAWPTLEVQIVLFWLEGSQPEAATVHCWTLPDRCQALL